VTNCLRPVLKILLTIQEDLRDPRETNKLFYCTAPLYPLWYTWRPLWLIKDIVTGKILIEIHRNIIEIRYELIYLPVIHA
jgi:hypothetical protein